MGIMFSAVFENYSVTNAAGAQDLFELNTGSANPITIHKVILTNTSSADVGDAQQEQLRILFEHNTGGSGGSGGATVTPVDLNRGTAQTATTVVDRGNTTQHSAGTQVSLWAEAWNVHSGFYWIPTPECRIHIPVSQWFMVALEAAPADDLTMSGTIVFEEHG